MGENAKKIGDKLELFGGQYLLNHFGWQELIRDCEIKCTRSAHKNKSDNKKKSHGIDLLSKFDDPYFNGQAVLIECKNRMKSSIIASTVSEWLKELINNVECAQSATELKSVGIDAPVLSTGLLIIHANDIGGNELEIDDILNGISIKSRRSPINIFVATNREINMWTSLFQFIEKKFKADDFTFVYPSINNMGKVYSKQISINALYSRYFCAQYKEEQEVIEGKMKVTKTIESNIMFSFDSISKESFRYMWSMFKAFQMQGSDEYKFCFYPRNSEDTNLIKKEIFIKAINQDDKGLTEIEKQKIHLLTIDNRSLSPVDTLGGENA